MKMVESPAQRSHIYPIDRFLHANEGRLTAGISPSSVMLAYLDWAVHLANSPGKQAVLVQKALRKSVKFGAYLQRLVSGKEEGHCIEPLPQDHRFRSPDWQQIPYAA
jgi:polyhydroxyalkanoate synthase